MAIKVEDVYKQKFEIDKISFEPIEAYERLKIARGYYAAYLYASSLFESTNSDLVLHSFHPNSKNLQKDRYGSHQKVSMSLIHSKVRILAEIGQKLILYHELRKKADYKLNLDITDDDIRNAEDCFEYCQERIEFYIKNGSQHFTKAKKVIDVTVGRDGITAFKGLKILK